MQCRRTCIVGISPFHAQGEDGVYRYQRMVLPRCQPAQDSVAGLRMGQHRLLINATQTNVNTPVTGFKVKLSQR